MKSSVTKTLPVTVVLALAVTLQVGCSQGPIPCPLSGSPSLGCCNGNVACTVPQHLYVTTSNQILSFNIDRTTGAPVFVGSVQGPSNPGSVLAELGTNFIYVSDFMSNAVDGFTSNGGILTPISSSPFSGVTGPAGLTGRFTFLYAANLGGNSLSAFNMSPDGSLTAVPGSPFAAVSGPEAVAVDVTHFLYASNSTGLSGEISGYSIDQNTGALTPVPGSPFTTKPHSAPGAVVVPGLGKFLFVALTNDNSVAAFAIDGSSGALTPVPGSPFAAGSQPLDLVADLGGHYLYMANGSAVTGFAIGSNGALSTIPGSPFPAGTSPSHLVVDSRGHLYVTQNGGDSLSGFSITPGTGALTPLSGSPFSLGKQPISITAGF